MAKAGELQRQRSTSSMTAPSSWLRSCAEKLPDGPTPILGYLCMILKRTEANIRHVLADMEELGLVEKAVISIPGRKVRHGWKKAVKGND